MGMTCLSLAGYIERMDVDVEHPAVCLPSGVVLRGEPGQTADEIAGPHIRASITAGRCPYHADPLDTQGYCGTCAAHWRLVNDGWEFSPDQAGLVERAGMGSRSGIDNPFWQAPRDRSPREFKQPYGHDGLDTAPGAPLAQRPRQPG
jgi:hypothetical protein